MKKPEEHQDPGMSDEYDFTGGVRGKHAARYAAGVTVTVKRTQSPKRGAPRAPSSPPRFPLEDLKLGRSSSHYVEVAR
jgi:hypothetical protein